MTVRASIAALVALLLVAAMPVRAQDSGDEIAKLRAELESIRKQLNAPSTTVRSNVDKLVDSKVAPSQAVTTKNGKLTIGGLVQVWYYSIDNDNDGLFHDANVNDVRDTNETQDNDSFRIRRTELRFTMDIHENVTAVVMIDPAREAQSFPNVTGNQGLFKRRNNIAPEQVDNIEGSTTSVANVQTGAGGVPRMLQDAYINYHGVIPHHDFTIGQYKPFFGEEGIRSSSQLDFVERSMLGQIGDARDLGLTVHGSWWDERFQYWLGLFNGAGNYWGTAGQGSNRSDDNDEKDFVGRMLVRPLWKNECWGDLELGYSFRYGIHGESAADDPSADGTPINGLNRNKAQALAHAAWLYYAAGGAARGLWLRGEYQYIRDRVSPGSLIDLAGAGTTINNTRTNSGDGWYAALGYHVGKSRFADDAPGFLKGFEFVGRYEQYYNVQVADLVDTAKVDDFKTQVWTFGFNYYIKGHNAKIQANYNIVNDPDEKDSAGRNFNQVDNNSFVVNFQVAF